MNSRDLINILLIATLCWVIITQNILTEVASAFAIIGALLGFYAIAIGAFLFFTPIGWLILILLSIFGKKCCNKS